MLPFLNNFSLQLFLLRLPALIIALTFHEFFHGFAAYLLGDRTAKQDGRLSFNPLKHIDPIGMILILVVGFGWAKPVMVNPFNLKNPKQDMAIIAVAGPLSNFIMAFVVSLIHMFFYLTIDIYDSASANNISLFLGMLARINIVLGVFNMIPIPPLDGSKLFGAILPDHLYFRYIGFRHGFVLLLVLIVSGATTAIIGPFIEIIHDAFLNVGWQIFSFLR